MYSSILPIIIVCLPHARKWARQGICLEEVIKRLSDNPILGEKCETYGRPKYRTPQKRGPLNCGWR